jgi:hypothetical protein
MGIDHMKLLLLLSIFNFFYSIDIYIGSGGSDDNDCLSASSSCATFNNAWGKRKFDFFCS